MRFFWGEWAFNLTKWKMEKDSSLSEPSFSFDKIFCQFFPFVPFSHRLNVLLRPNGNRRTLIARILRHYLLMVPQNVLLFHYHDFVVSSACNIANSQCDRSVTFYTFCQRYVITAEVVWAPKWTFCTVPNDFKSNETSTGMLPDIPIDKFGNLIFFPSSFM